MSPLRLGASLYVPATRSDLTAVANGERMPRLRSVVFCLEDAVRPGDLGAALDALAASLVEWEPSNTLRFVRPRSPDVLRLVLALPGASAIDGFVLPKLHRRNLPAWWEALGEHRGVVMPTLETREVFDPSEMHALRRMLSRRGVRERILSLRIGGNDLLQCLGVRRSPDVTLYETALGPVIAALATTFRPFGFNVTGPVFEGLAGFDVLRREVALDLAHGLFGKTAIHPSQVAVIEAGYSVSAEDLEAAERILDPDAPAVFRMGETMCEPATHRRWAQLVRERAALYGVVSACVELSAG
ncbi:MAG: HpcH/HpaI aldolase/citrate lyase family protein [Pseudomonadota bacterium]|nr:HpcH/HpaI aldolase/citrate lyase family protein [Pseudomonadota bacterium]